MKNLFHSIFILSCILLISACNDSSSSQSSPTSIISTTSTPPNPLGWVIQLGAVTHAPSNPVNANAGGDFCTGTATDSAGNVYCAGYTNGNLGEVNGGLNDAFVMKLNSSGTILWVTQLGSTTKATGITNANASNDYCNSVAVDSLGNVYCGGYTNGNLGAVVSGTSDAFVMKLNSSGELQWVKQFGSTGSDSCRGIAIDRNNMIYCGGYTDGSFGETNAGSNDIFITKLTSSGTIQWTKQLGTTTKISGVASANAGFDLCNSVAVDPFATSVYCAGETSGNIGEVNAGNSNHDAFIAKFSASDGSLQWVTQLGTTTKIAGVSSANTGYDMCNGVAVDKRGDVYCGGNTRGNLGDVNINTFEDAFIMKVSSAGSLLWLTQLGSTTYPTNYPPYVNYSQDFCQSVAVDGHGNAYCGGYTTENMGEENASPYVGYDAVVFKVNCQGKLQWVKQAGSTTHIENPPAEVNAKDDTCNSIALNSSGDIFCSGYTSGNVGEVNYGTSNSYDAIVAKFKAE